MLPGVSARQEPGRFLILIVLVGALEFGCGGPFGALIAALVPEGKRVATRASLRSLFNLGVSIGALIAAVLIALPSDTAMHAIPLGDAATFALAAFLVTRLPFVDPQGGVEATRFGAIRDVRFMSVVGSVSLASICDAVIAIGLPLWVVIRNDLPDQIVPILLVINTVAVVLLQVAVSRGADEVSTAARLVRRSALVSAIACLLLSVVGNAPAWVVLGACLIAVVLFTASELWLSAGSFGLAFGLSPEAAQSEYLGTFQLHMAFQATVGPILLSTLLVGLGPPGWAVLSLLFIVTAAIIVPSTRWASPSSFVDPMDSRDAGAR